jgi:hypothetical protein
MTGIEPHAPGDEPRVPAPSAGLPDDLQRFADDIALVQQRIQRSSSTGDEAARLSRELRRAVDVGRHDTGRGRSALARLTARLDASEAVPD